MTRFRSQWRKWTEGQKTAIAFVVAGMLSPLIAANISSLNLRPLIEVIGLSIMAAGLMLFVVRAHRGVGRSVDVLTVDVRHLADRVERSAAHVETTRNQVAAIEKIVDGERRNLGMVAGGLGEMRQVVHLERQNLGLLAHGVDEIRDVLRTFDDGLQAARRETEEALSRLNDAAAQASGISTRLDDLQNEVRVERHHLGLVAGALDDVRRLSAGVHLFDARQAAFEDTLIQIADRIDRIGGDYALAARGEGLVETEQRSATPGRGTGKQR